MVVNVMTPVWDDRRFRDHQPTGPDTADVPVPVLSASPKVIEESGRLNAVADGSKPFDLEELGQSKKSVLRRELQFPKRS
ncbi:MAG: hypothetical protein KatS3mg060_3311 [Dehalococcoidia bacterium]|nr:MAG: hypothetical protein KatS3mg060_3311 [Dehalococcoidia bacterium]